MKGFYFPCARLARCGISSAALSQRALSRALAAGQQGLSGQRALLRAKPLAVTAARHSSDGDHVKLWTAERVLSVGLLAAIPAAVLVPTPAVETVLALSLTLHSHWGIEALVHDYVRPAIFGAWIPRISVALVYGISAMTFAGLCFFVWADVGIVNAVAMLWRL